MTIPPTYVADTLQDLLEPDGAGDGWASPPSRSSSGEATGHGHRGVQPAYHAAVDDAPGRPVAAAYASDVGPAAPPPPRGFDHGRAASPPPSSSATAAAAAAATSASSFVYTPSAPPPPTGANWAQRYQRPHAWPSTGPYAGAPRVSDKAGEGEYQRGVKYIAADRLSRYLVTVGHTLQRRDLTFDTAEIKQHFLDKRGGSRNMGKAGQRGAPIGVPQYAKRRDGDWFQSSLIWVCVPTESDAVFYSHVGKIQRFHHSSFTAGAEVLGAGEWIVEKGYIKQVSAVSGHYRPDLNALITCVRMMVAKHGHGFEVLLWSRVSNDWERVPAQDVVNGIVGKGRYAAFGSA